MNKKCLKGHAMEDSHKRCPECGGERGAAADADADDMAKAVCGSCGLEAPATQKHCGDCGQPMLKAEQVEADLTAALDELDTLAKANVALSDKVETPAAATDDDPELADLLKADASGNIDALPILEAIRLSQNRVAATNLAAATETRATRRELGAMMKAFITRERGRDRQHRAELQMMKSELAGVKSELATLAGSSRGHRSRLTITEQPKVLGDGKDAGAAVTMDRDTFMAKAHVAYDKDKLSSQELAETETWVNQGGTNGLAMMHAGDPALYGKVLKAIAEVTQ
jgi:hypothetical protein